MCLYPHYVPTYIAWREMVYFPYTRYAFIAQLRYTVKVLLMRFIIIKYVIDSAEMDNVFLNSNMRTKSVHYIIIIFVN